MPIPYNIERGEVLALRPEAPDAAPPAADLGDRVMAPAYNPHHYVRHVPATVIGLDGDRATVRYDPGHGVNHYGPVYRGWVYRCDLRPLRLGDLGMPAGSSDQTPAHRDHQRGQRAQRRTGIPPDGCGDQPLVCCSSERWYVDSKQKNPLCLERVRCPVPATSEQRGVSAGVSGGQRRVARQYDSIDRAHYAATSA